MITIIDYGAGNLRSVKKAFDYIGVRSRIISRAQDFKVSDRVVLPGVGAFGAAVKKLELSGFFPILRGFLKSEGIFLGICLGMQLLMETSEEAYKIEGLKTLRGTCKRFTVGKVPQIGWNQVRVKKESVLFKGIKDNSFFYFNHGYFVSSDNPDIVAATTDYFINFPSIIESGNIYAVQFHPEKSGDTGLMLLKNWVEKC